MKKPPLRTVAGLASTLAAPVLFAQPGPEVGFSAREGAFAVSDGKRAASVVTDPNDWPAVRRAAEDLRRDILRVTRQPSGDAPKGPTIYVGTIGHSPLIDGLIQKGKIDVAAVRGKWEASVTQVVDLPKEGRCLIIAGSDRRGTVYGIYDLSRKMGVSPWYWWADVPVKRHRQVFVSGRHVASSPVVKYRGFFINDEEPGLGGWAREKFGGVNSKMYAHVFELMLRLRANYLWPAMWGKAFSQDDPLNPKVADEYGVVMGTSHVEPMMRADIEWNRLGFGEREWNYQSHPTELEKFWREGVLRNGPYENVVTMAMRGKIDTPMSETANIALLEKIVAAQREILRKELNPDVTQIPQLWCLYKEVQEYYEKGMRVPDDITLLWADDNWGNIRKLPTPEERKRKGGAGVYCHFDYVGGPRNYKWLDTNPLPKIWEQMNLAYRYGANQIWIVNVGDLKPMEFPLEFFLAMAHNPEAIRKEDLDLYTERWTAREFGEKHAKAIAQIMTETKRLNGRRKPELIDPNTWSQLHYREAETLLKEYRELLARAKQVESRLPVEARDAYFQLVLHPLEAMTNLTELYDATAKNRLYAAQGRASAELHAHQARAAFAHDKEITARYHALAGGKWNHQMDQTHIGYTYWQQPDRDEMPKLATVDKPRLEKLGVAIEGSAGAWPSSSPVPTLAFDRFGAPQRRIEVFRTSAEASAFKITPSAPWIRVSRAEGRTESDQAIEVSIDWRRLAVGEHRGTVQIEGGGVQVEVPVVATARPRPKSRFVEGDGVIAIEGEHYDRAETVDGVHWATLPGYGRFLSAISPSPVEFPTFAPGKGPWVEYAMTTYTAGEATLHLAMSPSLAFQPGRGLRLAVAFDDETPQVIDVAPAYLSREWEQAVSDSVHVVRSRHRLAAGKHTLKVWAIDGGTVLERLVLDLGGLKPSTLGPRESTRIR